jgi:hypothetical protein
MKRLMGKTEVEDALERLDVLTQEENLMAVARTFEATHCVDVNVKTTQELTQHVDTVLQQVDGNVKATQELTHHVDNNVMEIQELTCDVHADVEVIKEGTRTIDDNIRETKGGAFTFQFLHTNTDHPFLCVKTVMDDLQRSSLPGIMINRCG